MHFSHLGVWGEHWTDVSTLPDFPAWQELARIWEVESSAENLSYHMTRNLLPEIIYAAGGVEHEFARIEHAMEDARHWTDQISNLRPSDKKTLVVAPSLLTASLCFGQLLMWARAVQERAQRRSIKTKDDLGLLPASSVGH
jgi:hypothetical protein